MNQSPFRLRVGAVVAVDTLKLQLLQEHLMFAATVPTQVIEQASHIQINPDTILHRYYGNDVIFHIGTTKGQVDSVQMFKQIHEIFPENWAEWIGENGYIGHSEFEVDGKIFNRAWMEDTIGSVTPTLLTEEFNSKQVIEHRCMLYARYIMEDADYLEWLLVTAEDRGDTGSVKFYIGVDLPTPNFTVTA